MGVSKKGYGGIVLYRKNQTIFLSATLPRCQTALKKGVMGVKGGVLFYLCKNTHIAYLFIVY